LTRRERVLRKVRKLEMAAIRAAINATKGDPLGWAAHRAGNRASELWMRARLMLSALADREAAAKREKKARKMPTEWWKRK
jgi:hypothetical protein